MNPTRRREQAECWAAEQAGLANWTSEAVSSDAGFRSYYRLIWPHGSLVVMDAPPRREPVIAFIDIARRLRSAGLHAPEVKCADPDLGFVLLEDLGCRPYHHVLDADNADALFEDALMALRIMQTRVDTAQLPVYDPARLLQELALFPDWFLARHWQVEPSDDELNVWDHVCTLLIRWAQDQPQVFCHRDFMPRNLMFTEPNPGIIDFQDALIGPISYDPICLFRDAFLSWPQARVDAWLEDYRIAGRAEGLALPDSAELWRRTCDFMGVQRHLKVIGIFARIRYRDGKPTYLEDVPRFFAYLAQAIARNPELAPLRQLLTAWQARRRLPQ